MKEKNYNKRKFKNALYLTKINPVRAKKEYEDYLEANPDHYRVYTYYASVLITLGEVEAAENILNYVNNLVRNDEEFIQSDFFKMYDNSYFYTKLKLLSYQRKYEELYEFCLNGYQFHQEMSTMINILITICKKKLGILNEIQREGNLYVYRQIIKYDESELHEHLKKHLKSETDDMNNGIFSKDFPLFEVIKEAKKYIPSGPKIYEGFYEDVYVFKYNLCGKINNSLEDYFKVICFHDTEEIITIYPAVYSEESPHINLNYLKEEIEKPKVKVLSQIEKFNKKYRRN